MHAPDPEGVADPTAAAVDNGVSEAHPALSKKKAKKAKKMTQKIKIAPGSVDAMVQHTNDDSVVSKRSAVTHQYMQDPFLRHFVKKPSRRSPLINRGYYLRMKVIDDTITELLRAWTNSADAAAGPVQVVSLGAGFDTYALRALLAPRADMPSTEHVYFYDVDFPAVMQNKAALMRAAPKGTFPDTITLRPETPTHTVASTHYNAVGVDLRESSTTLLPLLTAASAATGAPFSTANPTIIYAECVMQYMPAADAQALVHFLAQHFEDAIFVAYDQIHPTDSFGHVMQQSLRQKSSPLLGIDERPDGRALTQSALRQGMACALFANFYDLSRHIIAGEERARVNALEPFDELEEWAEMCEHYGITLATTRPERADCMQRNPAFKPIPPLEPTAASVVPAAAHTWPTGRFGFEGWGNGMSYLEQLPSSAATSGRDDALIVSFGGFVVGRTHERVNTVFVHSLREGDLHVVTGSHDESSQPPGLCFHSFTRIAPFLYVVFGGRTNPTDVHGDAYLLQVQLPSGGLALGCHVTAKWRRLRSTGTSSPSARYRHMACAVSAPSPAAKPTVLLFGGKTVGGGSGESALLDDCWRGAIDVDAATVEWSPLPLAVSDAATDSAPPAMCSAALTFSPTGALAYLTGGLLDGERCSSWVYTIDPATGACGRLPDVTIGGRFSHSACIVEVGGDSQLFVLGGSTCAEKESVSPAVLLSLAPEHRVAAVALPPNTSWWSRHSCLPLATGTVAVVGGGYTCFSFGTFTSRPVVLRLGEDCAPWPLPAYAWTSAASPAPESDAAETAPDAGGAASPLARLYATAAAPLSYARLLCLPRPSVETRSYSTEAFTAVAKAATRPVVFRNVPLGPCVERWASPAYLKAAEGTATVSVHVAEGSTVLDFVRKNFVHRHVSFAALVDHVTEATSTFTATSTLPAETWYYRSTAVHMKSDRANLWEDFPTLGADFQLPAGVHEFVMPRMHQSCLRINAAPLQLWTHYDTQDNVLCQIVGRKRVVLFPPGCHNDLYMSGSSSPVLNIDAPDLLKYPRFVDACKQATEVVLEPGDMLYFPANWFHHITTLPDTGDETAAGNTVSVNIFFRHFDAAEYDPKDLYGNKDLPVCAELREKVVTYAQTLVNKARLRSATEAPVPAEYTRFALHQAIQDLERLLAAEDAAAKATHA